MAHIFITGTTGFMGSHFLLKGLRDTSNRFFCLARADAKQPAGERVLRALQTAARDSDLDEAATAALSQAFAERVVVLAGDIRGADLGIDANVLKIDAVWHFAAQLGFADRLRNQLESTIVSGTRNLIAFAAAHGAKEINYVSTAYVAGRRNGMVSETAADETVPVNNVYEEVKRNAEKLIMGASAHGLSYRIFRPSVVVGHSVTGKADSETGYYGVLNVSCKLKAELDNKVPDYFEHNTVGMVVDQGCAINMIHVDQAIMLMHTIAAAAGSHDRIFHVTSPESVPVDVLHKAIEKSIGIRYCQRDRVEDLSPVDYLIHLQASEFRPYMSGEYQFDLTNTLSFSGTNPGDLKISLSQLMRLTQAYVDKHQASSEKRAKSAESILRRMERRTVEAPAGALQYYVGGAGMRTLVILNAYGQSLYFWNKLLGELYDKYRLIVWESRGTSGVSGGMSQFYRVGDHVQDVLAILDREVTDQCSLMGWCTGPKLALEVYARAPERINGMIFVTGSFKNLPGYEEYETQYEKNMDPLCRFVDRRPQVAGSLKESLKAVLAGRRAPPAQHEGLDSQVHDNVSQVLSLINRNLKPLVISPFLNETSIVNYARQLLDFWGHRVEHLLDSVPLKILLIAGEEDNIASSVMSQAIARRLPRSIFAEIKYGTHYVHYEHPELVASMIEAYLVEGSLQRVVDPLMTVHEYCNKSARQPQPDMA